MFPSEIRSYMYDVLWIPSRTLVIHLFTITVLQYPVRCRPLLPSLPTYSRSRAAAPSAAAAVAAPPAAALRRHHRRHGRHRPRIRGRLRLAPRPPVLRRGFGGKFKAARSAEDELGGQPECLLLQVRPLPGEASRVHLLIM